MPEYIATATREGRWWVIEVNGVGATQARSVAEAHEMAHALVVDLFAVPADTVKVEVNFVVPGLMAAVEDARQATADAVIAQQRAAEGSRRIAHQLHERGLSSADTAAVLRVSRARAQQLIKSS